MKLTIVTHGDTDGVCAAAVVWRKKCGKQRIMFAQPFSLGKQLLAVKNTDLLCILDIGVDDQNFENVARRLKELRHDGVFVIWIDHHEASEKVKLILNACTDICVINRNKSASQIANDIFGGADDLAVVGAASDKVIINKEAASTAGTLGAAMAANPRDDKFRRWLTKRIAKGLDAEGLERINGLALEAKNRLEGLLDKGAVVFNSKNVMVKRYGVEAFGSASAISGMLASRYNKVIVIISSVPGSPGLLVVSSRQPYYRKSQYDLAAIMRESRRLGGSGDGHKNAAGARIPEDKFEAFVDHLKFSFR
jgi:RecJ-like exonuclease